jgi:branched-chain amino acid transport system permease protein
MVRAQWRNDETHARMFTTHYSLFTIHHLALRMDLLLGILTIGLVNGSFYALLSLGLALIFGLLNVLNMTHGALYMMGAFTAFAAAQVLPTGALGNYLLGLVIASAATAVVGVAIEVLLLRRTYRLDPLYGFMLTFGLATAIQGLFQARFGSTGLPFAPPVWLAGGVDLGFVFLPVYRLFVVGVALAVCLAVWAAIARTRAGSVLRAASENGAMAQALGVRVPLVFTLTFGLGAALAGLAGALAAPVYQVSPLMGADILLVIFAIIVIGGMGSLGGTMIASYGLALIESLTQALYPQAASLVIFAFMCLVLLTRPQGLFGIATVRRHEFQAARIARHDGDAATGRYAMILIGVALAVAPALLYPVYLMKIFCLAIFAASFNFLLGFAGIVSFGQAALFGSAAYLTAHAMKAWSLPPQLGVLCGVAAATLLGVVMGALAIRRHGIYQAMITLGIAQMVYFVFLQAPFTHGEDGIQSVPRGLLFGYVDLADDRTLYAFIALALVAVLLGLRRLLASRFGLILVAIRDDERRALSLGYNVAAFKLAAFAIASACAGLAGALNALTFQLATLSGAHWHLSGEAVLMALVGGIGTLTGPLVGAAVVVTMQQFLAPFGAFVLVIQGLVFALCVLAFRDGLVVRLTALWHRLFTRLRATRRSCAPTSSALES